MGDISGLQQADVVRLTGKDEAYAADVILEDGLNKLVTTTTVRVESLNGFDDIPDNWFFINSVVEGATLTLDIDATDGAPALNKTYTVQVGETRNEFTARIVLELNQDFTNFQPYYKATKVKDNPIVHISSKFFGEWGENTTQDSFRVTTSDAGFNVVRAFDQFIRRGKVVGFSRTEDDPRFGVIGISGETVSRSGDIGGLFVKQPYHSGNEDNVSMMIDGSTAPVAFTFPMNSLNDTYIREVRLFGEGAGIKYGQFLSKNTSLTNGIKIEIKTDNQVISLPLIKYTEDFQNKFAFGSGDNFQLSIQSGNDAFLAVFISDSPFPLKRAGTFGAGNDDYIKIIIQDDITSGIVSLESLCFGFQREA